MGRHIGSRVTKDALLGLNPRVRYAAAAAGTLSLLALSVVAVLDARSPYARAESITATAKVVASDDSYTEQALPTKVNGANPRLTAGSIPNDQKVIYLKFTVTGLPAKLTALDASLTLQRDLHHLPATVVFHTVSDNSWSEKTLDAQNAPAVGAAFATATNTQSTGQVVVDVSKVVDGNGTYSIAVTSPAANDVARFRSTDYGSTPPTLTLRYSFDKIVSTPSPSASSTASPTKTVDPSPSSSPTQTDPNGGGGSGGGGGGGTCAPNAMLVPSCGVWWGAAPAAYTGLPAATGLAQYESMLGRPVDIVHFYHSSPQLFPTPTEKAIALQPGKNRMLLLNWKPEMGRTWAQVANGDPTVDAQIDKLAAYINATFPYKFFLTIHHEPENEVNESPGSGMTALDYRAMFRHVAIRLQEDGVHNAVIVQTFMAFNGWGAQPWFRDLYAGDDVVDWIAGDPYMFASPGGSATKDFATLVNRPAGSSWPGFYNWVTTEHPGKPIMLAEWGVFEYPADPALKVDIYKSVAAEIGRFPDIKALVYFNSANAPRGDTRIDSSSAALTEFRSLTDSSVFSSPQVSY